MITYIWLIALIVLSNTILLHISIQKNPHEARPWGFLLDNYNRLPYCFSKMI